jgi:hypothetical protein
VLVLQLARKAAAAAGAAAGGEGLQPSADAEAGRIMRDILQMQVGGGLIMTDFLLGLLPTAPCTFFTTLLLYLTILQMQVGGADGGIALTICSPGVAAISIMASVMGFALALRA